MRTVFAIDIETVPIDSTIPLEDEDLLKKASLDALTGRVACIGIIEVVDFNPLRSLSFCGEDERAILAEFWSFLARNRSATLLAHNGLQFDLPFIWRRSVIQKVTPSVDFDLRKFRTGQIFDTMQVWANWEIRGYKGLDDLAAAFGIGRKTDHASSVVKYWREGRLAEIKEYCLNDCWLCYACYCRMQFREPLALPSSEALANVTSGDRLHAVAAQTAEPSLV